MDFMKTLGNAQTLLGLSQHGGGKKKKTSKSRKGKKASKMMRPKKYRIGFFGGAKQFMCTEVDQPVPPPPPVAQQIAAPPAPGGQNGGKRSKRYNKYHGGKMSKKALAYKNMLSKMTKEQLQKKAAKRGVKLTKKKNGKTVELKKATLVRKLCECKYGKQ